MAEIWHTHAIVRTRVSTTVDDRLLASARELHADLNDAALIDAALRSLLAGHRRAQVDAGYASYDDVPLDTPDAWGDLASFREGAGAS